MIDRWLIIAGEEGGPYANKMGGIWNVIDAESRTMPAERMRSRPRLNFNLDLDLDLDHP